MMLTNLRSWSAIFTKACSGFRPHPVPARRIEAPTVSLIKAGKRVGIMAMSHAAIDNFLSETATVCEADPEADQCRDSHRTETGP